MNTNLLDACRDAGETVALIDHRKLETGVIGFFDEALRQDAIDRLDTMADLIGEAVAREAFSEGYMEDLP